MDRRAIVAFVLSFALIQAYFWWAAPKRAPEADPSAPVAEAPAATPGAPVTSSAPAAPAAPVEAAPARTVPLAFCGIQAAVSTDGGALRDLTLTQWKADFHATAVWSWAWKRLSGQTQSGWKPYDTEGGPARLLTADATFLAAGVGGAPVRFAVVSEAADKVELRGTVGGLDVTRTFAARPDCLVDVTTTYTNHGAAAWTGDLTLGAFDALDGAVATGVRPIAMADGDAVRWTSLPEEDDRYEGPVQWLGLHDHYFGVYAVGGTLPNDAVTFGVRKLGERSLSGEEWRAPVAIGPSQATVLKHTLYVGPKQIEELVKVAPDLKYAIDLGWFGLFVRPLLWMLKFIQGYVGNWGVSIVLLTLLVKTLLYPLQLRAFKSSQAMQELQPKIKELQARYVDQPEELSKQMMQLYAQSGANPVSGCLPMLGQIPVFISLYTMIGSAVEIHQQPFFYLQDLSSVDPIGILPLLVVGAMVLQQRSMPTANLDPAQQQVMQMMPLIFGVIMFSVPSGLVVYSLANIVLSMLQQWWMKRVHTREPVPAPA